MAGVGVCGRGGWVAPPSLDGWMERQRLKLAMEEWGMGSQFKIHSFSIIPKVHITKFSCLRVKGSVCVSEFCGGGEDLV